MGYNLLIKGVYWGYNPLTIHLLTSWDIQVDSFVGLGLFSGATTAQGNLDLRTFDAWNLEKVPKNILPHGGVSW